MKNNRLKNIVILSYFFLPSIAPIYKQSEKLNLVIRAKNSSPITLNVCNWEDYIAEDEENPENDIISLFQNYMLEEEGINVSVNYSTFDTNETMLTQLKIGSVNYDLICPSDYIIQKMVVEDLIQPFSDNSTPNYDSNVSPFIKEKISSIKIDGKDDAISKYCRPYMWGTLGILYNDGYSSLESRGIKPIDMRKDLTSWLSLWDGKYNNLLAIKDSMRDSYAIGILKTYYEDFEINSVKYIGFKNLKLQHDNKEITDKEYNEKLSSIFNLCDDTTLNRVEKELISLKKNSFGFEVDSGKTDMAKGDKFAINIAWSGDAVFAINEADEYSKNSNDKTVLKYSLPNTGANIWFDGWVIPKSSEHKEIAEKFVDFLSRTDIAYLNMEYIGYTPVIAGDNILSSLKSNYDIRYDETGNFHPEILNQLNEVKIEDIESLTDEEKENSYYVKDISYFFKNTLSENNDSVFYISATDRYRQFDTQYVDSNLLPSLCVMNDFGNQTDKIIKMWENVKNNNMPIWVYYLILVCVILLVILITVLIVNNYQRKKRRKKRKLERILKANRSKELMSILTFNL